MAPSPIPAAATLRAAPLVIDLDGTLLRTDLLLEGVIALLRRNPLMLLAMLLWLPRGRAFFKRRIAEGAGLDVATLPANEALLAHIEARKAAGQEIVLATRRRRTDGAAGTQALSRLRPGGGERRSAEPEGRGQGGPAAGAVSPGVRLCRRRRRRPAVWAAARRVIVVGASPAVLRAARRLGKPVEEFPAASRPRALFKALRPHQWAKNALVFLPLVLGGRAGEAQAWGSALMAFLALGLVASASYLLNDLLDLSHDRAHWSKRERPLASGRLSIATGVAALVVGFIGGLAGRGLCRDGGAHRRARLSHPDADLFRVAQAGADARRVDAREPVHPCASPSASRRSRWRGRPGSSPSRCSCSPRCPSPSAIRSCAAPRGAARPVPSPGRGYQPADEAVVLAFGVAAGLSSVVIFILYLANEAFHHAALAEPLALWSFPLILVLFMGRVWLLAGRDALHRRSRRLRDQGPCEPRARRRGRAGLRRGRLWPAARSRPAGIRGRDRQRSRPLPHRRRLGDGDQLG
jgi:hypothetical protein